MLDKKQIDHLSRLARLDIGDKEEKKLAAEVSRILDFISSLRAVDTTGVEPTYYQVEENDLRSDVAVADNDRADIIAAFPDREEKFLRTPKIFE